MAGSADSTDDAALVELARRDPGAGWGAIWDRHGAALHGYCVRLLGDRADADDVVADVFLVASQRIDQLREPDALRAWLFAISRRSVQRRWRARERTVPVDPQGATVMSQTTTDTTDDAVGADDAAEVVAAASAGLSVRDQELLALTLGADLDTTEVARITGEATSAISVRVTRLKETVAKAAGALLVARHHRRDCDVLDGILADWDGTFDTVWRKRIARHVESCDECEERRRGAVAVFAAPLAMFPPSDALRTRVLEPIGSTRVLEAPAGGAAPAPTVAVAGTEVQWSDDGFPVPGPWEPRTRRRAVAVLVAALVLVGVVFAVSATGDGGEAELAAAGGPSTSTTEPGPSTADIDTTTASTATSTTTVGEGPPVDGSGGQPADGGAAPGPSVAPAPAPGPAPGPGPTTTAAPPAPAPDVTLTIAVDDLTSCLGSTPSTDATVSVTAGGGGEKTTLAWGGGMPGSVTVSGTGVHQVVVGPFERDPGGAIDQTFTVVATTVDAAGNTATDSAPVTVSLVGC